MKNRAKIAFILVLLVILSSCGSKDGKTASGTNNSSDIIIDKDYGPGDKDIVIFSTNDTLAAYNENLTLSAIKNYYDNFDREENFTTLVDTGNFSAGTEEAEKSKGKSSVEIINAMGYDLVVPGSFEFNYGLDVFYENMKALGDKVVCCNLLDTKTGELVFSPYKIFRYNDLNIAFIGVTSPESLYLKINHDYFFDENGEQLLYFYEDEDGSMLYSQVQACVDAALEEGADKVILLAHLGVDGITTKWTSTEVILHTKNITAVIDGHSLEVIDSGLMLNSAGEFVQLVQAGSKLECLGAMNITKDGYSFPAIVTNRSVNKKDAEFQKKIDDILDKYK